MFLLHEYNGIHDFNIISEFLSNFILVLFLCLIVYEPFLHKTTTTSVLKRKNKENLLLPPGIKDIFPHQIAPTCRPSSIHIKH